VAVRHERRGVLPQFGRYGGAPSPSANQPSPLTAGWLGLIRTVYYSLDYFLGHVFRDRRISVDLGLVVYERCALDMYVSPTRYGLVPGRILRILVDIVPRQDLVVLLYEHPDGILERSPELQEEEVRKQLEIWMRLVDRGVVHMVVTAGDDPHRLAGRIVSGLVDLFVLKNSGGSHGGSAR
jgi:hypothetical protein